MRGRNLLLLLLGLAACAQDEEKALEACRTPNSNVIASEIGSGLVFDVDPVVASDNPFLSPLDANLDRYRSEVTLTELSGKGILDGKYITVNNTLQCRGLYLTFDELNKFSYSTQDPEFREVMSYYVGTEYRKALDQNGYLEYPDPVTITAQCRLQDNAFFIRLFSGGRLTNRVCLGSSQATPGAHYSDDSTVSIHELQHSATVNHYSLIQDLNQYLFDEAGSINEAVSDFMSLMFADRTDFPSAVDRRVFSRWALGKFFGNFNGSRGVHRCPGYDPSFPDCSAFSKKSTGFSADLNRVSYAFPDGMGWPYGNNFNGPGYLRNIFLNYKAQEQIHNVGVFFSGALWDSYEALVSLASRERAKSLMTKLVLETIRNLPKPSAVSISPVTFVGFAKKMKDLASAVGLTQTEETAVSDALTQRGLLQTSQLGSDWAAFGPGTAGISGLRIVDHPSTLRRWISSMGFHPDSIPQGPKTGLNQRFDSGEIVLLWFNIQNNDALTAGSVEVTAISKNSNLRFLGPVLNYGYIDQNKAQIRYLKINGSNIINALSSTSFDYHVPTGNTYFLTNPNYDSRWHTGIWAIVDGSANDPVEIELVLKPENGPQQTLNIQTKIVN